MRIGVLGTGVVGQTLASKPVALGHEVKMGSRTAGGEAATAWVAAAGERASQGTFEDAAAFGELLLNCTAGVASVEAVRSAGAENLAGKTLLDVANPLDFSRGMPPTMTICNSDSLGSSCNRRSPRPGS